MRKLALLLVVALAVPAAAIAAHKPSHPKPAAPAPTVQYVVKGTVSAYSPNASITIKITGGNRAAKRLFAVGTAPQFKLDATTKIVSASGIVAGTTGDKVLLKVKASKTASADTVRGTVAWQVVETS